MKQFDWTILFNKKYTVYTQLLFWIIVFFLYVVLKEYPRDVKGATGVCIVLQETLELAIPSYSQIFLILPFFKRKQWLAGSLLYVVQVVLLILLLPYILNFAGMAFAQLFPRANRVDWRLEHISFSIVAFTVIASIFRIGLDKIVADKKQKETELRHLKAQLNPHFLFNTLNNLYGLSVVQSPKLPELMLKLSGLLRYSLYDTNQHYVSLQKEITYITSYIELEKIRLDDKTQIEFEVTGEISDQHIAPLLLISFVENGFKHYSAPRNEKAFVKIHFNVHGNSLHMRVSNSLDPLLPPKALKAARGIGLSNTRERLHLLYPQKHTLAVTNEPEIYIVDLTIDLT